MITIPSLCLDVANYSRMRQPMDLPLLLLLQDENVVSGQQISNVYVLLHKSGLVSNRRRIPPRV